MAARTRRQPAGSTASEICCRVGLASSSTATAYLQLACLHRLAGVLRGGDLPRRETDPERGDADQHGDPGDPEQRVGVAVPERVELRGRHVLHRPRGATQVQTSRTLYL